jgi:hypothetical protein
MSSHSQEERRTEQLHVPGEPGQPAFLTLIREPLSPRVDLRGQPAQHVGRHSQPGQQVRPEQIQARVS